MVNNRLVQNLRVRMAQRLLTQKALALKAGLNETAVRDILKGRSKDPQYGTLAALANILNCKVADFFEEAPLFSGTLPTPRRGRPTREQLAAAAEAEGRYYGVADKPVQWPVPPIEGRGRRKGRKVPEKKTASSILLAPAPYENCYVSGSHLVEERDTRNAENPSSLSDGRRKVVTGNWQVPLHALGGDSMGADADLVMVCVSGDAMAPDLRPDDRVLVNLSDRQPSPPGLFLLWDGVGFVIRRVEVRPDTRPMKLTLRALNPQYGAHDVSPGNVDIRGRIVAHWRKV